MLFAIRVFVSAKELSVYRRQLGYTSTGNEQNSKNAKDLSCELEQSKAEINSLKESVVEKSTLVHELEACLRLRDEEVKRLQTKVERHDVSLEKAVSLKTDSLMAEFATERNKLKHQIDHLQNALRIERNNHMISNRALEQLQLHFGAQDVNIRRSLERNQTTHKLNSSKFATDKDWELVY